MEKKITLTIDGEIVLFESLAISKLIHLGLDTEIATSTIKLLTKIQMEFICKRKIRKSKLVLHVITANMED